MDIRTIIMGICLALGVGIAAIILGERRSLQDVFGVLVVMAGIFAVQISRAKI